MMRSILPATIALTCLIAPLTLMGPAAATRVDSMDAAIPPETTAPCSIDPDPASLLQTHAYWVFFSDRGPRAGQIADAGPGQPEGEGSGGRSQEILRLARAIPPEVWARRARAGRALLPDEHDRPLWDPYVRSVAKEGRLRHRSRWLNAVSADLTPEAIAIVAALPFVTGVRPVAIARRASLGPERDESGRLLERVLRPVRGTPPDFTRGRDGPLAYGPSHGQLSEINVPAVHEMGYSGNRVRFMMIDTGFRKDHEAFTETELLAEWDFIFGDGNVQNEPDDDPSQHNHGTACWGVAGGYSPGNLIGPAYGATFALAKTEDIRSETQAEEDYYVAALEWADSLGVVLTSASLCYICFDDGFCYEFEDKDGDTAVITIAIDIAASRGIICANAMGNYGCDTGSLGTPADADSMIAVGAVDSLNQIAHFSACGPTYDGRIKPEVLARGVDTYCARASEIDSYGYASGTSVSTPLVGGAAALLLEAHPEWGPMDVREALKQTADRAGFPDNQYGWGRIDVEAAIGWTPVLYPVPFSLVRPEDGAIVYTPTPTFIWRASEDPDNGDPLLYTLWVEDYMSPGTPWSVEAGTDTVITLPFPLEPDRTYLWEVTAEDLEGNRRYSRETFTLTTSGTLDVSEADGHTSPIPRARLQLSCAPNPFREVLRFQVEVVRTTLAEDLPLAACPNPPLGVSPGTHLQWAVYDPLGRRLASGESNGSDGSYEACWTGGSCGGGKAKSGVYYLETRIGNLFARETIVLLGG